MARWAWQRAAEEGVAAICRRSFAEACRGVHHQSQKTFDRDQRGGFSWPSHYQHQQQRRKRRKTEVTCNEAQSIWWAFCISLSASSSSASSALLFSFSAALVVAVFSNILYTLVSGSQSFALMSFISATVWQKLTAILFAEGVWVAGGGAEGNGPQGKLGVPRQSNRKYVLLSAYLWIFMNATKVCRVALPVPPYNFSLLPRLLPFCQLTVSLVSFRFAFFIRCVTCLVCLFKCAFGYAIVY